ncbi:MAG: hypothetical protein ACTSUC_01805 [Promethearchaeota archaeon]
MKKWPLYIFMKFLYQEFGNPREIKNMPDELQVFRENSKEYPELKYVEPESIELRISNEQKTRKTRNKAPRKIDFELENKRKRILGFRSEKIVEIYEKRFLQRNGLKKLANEIIIMSLEDDSLGFDIVSYDLNER